MGAVSLPELQVWGRRREDCPDSAVPSPASQFRLLSSKDDDDEQKRRSSGNGGEEGAAHYSARKKNPFSDVA